jgi:hypothetical protein
VESFSHPRYGMHPFLLLELNVFQYNQRQLYYNEHQMVPILWQSISGHTLRQFRKLCVINKSVSIAHRYLNVDDDLLFW